MSKHTVFEHAHGHNQLPYEYVVFAQAKPLAVDEFDTKFGFDPTRLKEIVGGEVIDVWQTHEFDSEEAARQYIYVKPIEGRGIGSGEVRAASWDEIMDESELSVYRGDE